MEKYTYSQEGFGGTGISFSTSDEFGDIELFGTLMQFKSMQKEFWERIGIGGSITASPIIYKETIYFGACDKRFYALDMNGNEKWHYDVNGNIVKWADACDGLIYFGSFDGAIYALDTKGKLAWKFESQGRILDNPTVYKGRVYSGSADNNIYCLDAKTGKKIWKFTTGDFQAAVLVHKDRLYFGYYDNTFYCLDLDGRLVWKFRTPNMICAWPADALDDMVYFGCYDKNIYALNLDGELKWKYEAGDVAYPPIIAGEKLLFGSRDNYLYCLDPKTGRKIWRFKTGGFISFSVLYKGVVYFGSYDYNVYAVDFNTGKELWRFKSGGFVTYVTVRGDRIYFGCWDCHLYCLDLQGRLIWKFATSMQTPAKIAPPETTKSNTVEIALGPIEGKKEEAGAGEENVGDYGVISGNYLDVGLDDGMKTYKSSKKYGR